MDFLATYMAEQIDGGLLAKELEALLGCQVGLSKNLEGSDIQVGGHMDSWKAIGVTQGGAIAEKGRLPQHALSKFCYI